MCMICDAHKVSEFVTAGNATLTISSKKTNARYTYKVKATKDTENLFFVSLLAGADNTSDFTYLGILSDTGFRVTAKSRYRPESKPALAFKWLADKVILGGHDPHEVDLEVRHEGRCARCGRPLTTPDSIDRGIGPECASKL